MTRTAFAEQIALKRAYEPPAAADGARVLVERLWPRGVRKADLRLDVWMKDVAPSAALRRWFNHAPERWPEFRERYKQELHAHQEELNQLRALAQHGRLTLVYGARDTQRNSARVLQEVLLEG